MPSAPSSMVLIEAGTLEHLLLSALSSYASWRRCHGTRDDLCFREGCFGLSQLATWGLKTQRTPRG